MEKYVVSYSSAFDSDSQTFDDIDSAKECFDRKKRLNWDEVILSKVIQYYDKHDPQ